MPIPGARASRTLADALLCLVDGRGLFPHAAWARGMRLAEGDAELRLGVVIRTPFPAMALLLRARRGRLLACCLEQTLCLHAL